LFFLSPKKQTGKEIILQPTIIDCKMPDSDLEKKVMEKILNADKGLYVIFYTEACKYSQCALELLQDKNLRLRYKGYKIQDKDQLLTILRKNAETIGFNVNHYTSPIIFFNSKFLGGATDLYNHFTTNINLCTGEGKYTI
jgi:glutaredoxin